MNACFYDIESLDNVFTLCNYRENDNIVDIYVLSDDSSLVSAPTLLADLDKAIHNANKNFTGTIRFLNLQIKDAGHEMARTFGLSSARNVNDPDDYSDFPKEFRPVCDTDSSYNEDKHPYLFGYNSYNYDTTMLSLFFTETFPIQMSVERQGNSQDPQYNQTTKYVPTTAALMRQHNNKLFTSDFKSSMPSYLAAPEGKKGRPDYSLVAWKVRKSMLMSGRHLDVARLNEKQQHVALKRLLGMLGFQILESDKLKSNNSHIENYEQFLELIAYNVSDVVNLAALFHHKKHKVYQSNFLLKKELLKTYPELVYEKKRDAYAPDIGPTHVRRDRLTIDSSSAQFATKSLCPYGHLKDIPAVSFMYPSEQISKERNIPRRNILEETRKFFYDNFPQPELRAEFDRIYYYYKSIEGRNFNQSNNYQFDYGEEGDYNSFVRPESIESVPKTNTCLYYYNKDGTPSSCFVVFSTGGIHGAEYNKKLYEYDMRTYQKQIELFAAVQQQYPDPIDLKKAKAVEIDGVKYEAKKFLTAKSTLKKAEYRDPTANKPVLFKENKKGQTKLNDRYTYTSADRTNHEDFTSYYPNLLIAMSAFYNRDLGYDRYNEIFDNKQRFGKLMKDKSIPQDEREVYAIQREGTKLVLNSASGAGDATFESNIRMNNQIISMRIIGQLFSYRIGQAQTIAGARITSTNTDGLYSVLEDELNNEILARESATISVAIEPEPLYLISKDSNNRLEMDPATGTIFNASGGSLSCRECPNPTKSLNHPAIIDWALTEYLIVSAYGYKGLHMSAPFDPQIGLSILHHAKDHFKDKVDYLLMFQNVLTSSTGSIAYIFGTKNNKEEPIILQHYNRVFIMKDDTPDCPNLMNLQSANAQAITPIVKAKRMRSGEAPRQPNPLALHVLEQNGVTLDSLPDNKEPTVKKVTNVDPEWQMFIQNKDLNYLSDEEVTFILDNLDYEKYLYLLNNAYEKSWRNLVPEMTRKVDEE